MALLASAFKAPRIFRSTIKAMGFGMQKGSGGSVTQLTDKTTAVTLNKLAGQITMAAGSIAAEGSAEFTVNNTKVGQKDVIVACIQSGKSAATNLTDVTVSTVAEGSFKLFVSNGNVAAGAAETGLLIINFVVIKSVIV